MTRHQSHRRPHQSSQRRHLKYNTNININIIINNSNNNHLLPHNNSNITTTITTTNNNNRIPATTEVTEVTTALTGR
jgi:hypothetical protein